jgi:hypothetical protein
LTRHLEEQAVALFGHDFAQSLDAPLGHVARCGQLVERDQRHVELAHGTQRTRQALDAFREFSRRFGPGDHRQSLAQPSSGDARMMHAGHVALARGAQCTAERHEPLPHEHLRRSRARHGEVTLLGLL